MGNKSCQCGIMLCHRQLTLVLREHFQSRVVRDNSHFVNSFNNPTYTKRKFHNLGTERAHHEAHSRVTAGATTATRLSPTGFDHRNGFLRPTTTTKKAFEHDIATFPHVVPLLTLLLEFVRFE